MRTECAIISSEVIDMALHGNQDKFDRDHDGKLTALEYSRWYYAKYGHDMEMQERGEITLTVTGEVPQPKKKHHDIIAMFEHINNVIALAGEPVDTKNYDSFVGIEEMELDKLESFYEENSRFFYEFLSAEPENTETDEHKLWEKLMDTFTPIVDAADYRLHPDKL